jgi:uncharacterized membrane protein YdjX (TVP38/TMEM64 family)
MKKKVKEFFKKNWLILLIILIVIVWFTYSYFSGGVVYSTANSDVDSVVDFINSFGFWAWLIFILLVILEVVLAPIPPLVLYIAGGFIFGAFIGGVLTLVGNMIGAGIDFLLANRYGRGIVENKVDKKIRKKFDNFSEKYGGFAIFLLRVNPLTTTDLVSYLAGLSKIKFWKFIMWTALGLIPMIFIQTYFGDVFVRGNGILSALVIILSILYLIFFVYLIVKVFIKKNSSSSQ